MVKLESIGNLFNSWAKFVVRKIREQTGINLAKYSTITALIAGWIWVAFNEIAKTYLFETGIVLSVLIVLVIGYDCWKRFRRKR